MRKLLWAASAATLAIASHAHAQESTAAADSQGAPAADGYQIDDIVVTASRRTESVQDSSLSIAVVGGEALQNAGVSNATDLGTVVPGLTVSLGGGSVQTYLRGVGSFATDAAAESAIAYNINGVYISRPNGIGPIFFDLDRVEVLKGPQGTLYGRNATGGAINLITKRPTAELSGEFSAEIGNYDLVKLTGAVGGGTETLSARAAVQLNRHDGYLTDGYDDQDSIASRLTILARPAEGVDLLVTGEYVKVDSQGGATVKRSTLTATPSNPWEGPSIGNAQQPPTAFIPGGTRINPDGFNNIEVMAISAELNIDLGGATLTFLPAYRDTRASYLTYTPGFYFDTDETSKQQSYELRIGNSGSRLKWVAGLYYFDEQQTQFYTLRALPIQFGTTQTDLSTRAYAGFGEATFSVTDSIRLIAGARYSRDEKRQSGLSVATLPSPGTNNNFGARDFENFSWKLGAEADVGPDSMLFATGSTAYKAGGFFPSVPAPNNSFEPEKLTAFTIGSRNQFLDRTLQINLEGFYWKYDNKQERYLGATPAGTTGLLTANAGKATLWGGNIDVVFKPSRNGQLRFSVEYLNTKYDSFIYSVYNPPIAPPFPGFVNSAPAGATTCAVGPVVPYTANNNPPLPPGVPVPPILLTDSTQSVNCSGKSLVRAPELTGSAGYQHSFDVGNGSRIVAGVDAQFSSEQFLSPDFIQAGRDDGYLTFNADLTFHYNDHFSIGVWGRNLSKQEIYTGGGRFPFSRPAPAGDPSLFYATIRAPRTYGITLKSRL
jgi:iron complex outermembrane receptor protein